MYYLYILRCKDGSFYTGITKNIGKRIKEHSCGSASKYTRARRPVKLVYKEKAGSKSEALKRELRIKKMTRREKEKLISS